jgi:hypothetical protein
LLVGKKIMYRAPGRVDGALPGADGVWLSFNASQLAAKST